MSVDRALAWLAREQQDDGSFATDIYGQPGVTGLATLAFLSWGHEPGVGKHGETINRALAYIGRLYGVERAAQELADRAPPSTEQAWRDWHLRRRELRQ